jgi:hypothetical protein
VGKTKIFNVLEFFRSLIKQNSDDEEQVIKRNFKAQKQNYLDSHARKPVFSTVFDHSRHTPDKEA